MNVALSISEASKILPVNWPLPASIAVNPLWDLVEKPIERVIAENGSYLAINGSLSAEEYHHLLKKDKITKNDLKKSICEFLKKNKQTEIPENILHSILNIFLSNELFSALNKNELSIARKKTIFQHHDMIEIKNSMLEFFLLYFNNHVNFHFSENPKNGLFETWKEYKILKDKAWKDFFKTLSKDKSIIKHEILTLLNINENLYIPLFKTALSQFIGWAGLAKWSLRPNNPFSIKNFSLDDILLIWLCHLYEKKQFEKSNLFNEIKHFLEKPKKNKNLYQLLNKEPFIKERIKNNFILINTIEKIDIFSIYFIYQSAWEKKYHSQLINLITPQQGVAPSKKIEAQFIFCIDTRSEGLRRHLETTGAYQTFGYAGFFGCLFELNDKINHKKSLQCPAIVEPHIKLSLECNEKNEFKNIISNIFSAIKEAKDQQLSPFSIFEIFGIYIAYFFYSKNQNIKCFQNFTKKIFRPDEQIYFESLENFLSKIDYSQFIENLYCLLRSVGLTENMSEYVFICAHGSEMNNNPFQATYECGACGGNNGSMNAILACAALNDHSVRKRLEERSIRFGKNTQFIPAVHNTTTDKIEILTRSVNIPECILKNLSKASGLLQKERLKTLPSQKDCDFKKSDWADMIPEWALANNACMIIGPRDLTQNKNLERRSFLHSYEPCLDPKGEILENIMTAPLIVVHWINMQYYFSATDPKIYGSGNKAIHNVVPSLGVMEGNISDLKFGLPLQSVFFKEKRIHEPRRLFVIIYAKKEHVNKILDKHKHVKSIFEGEWAFMHVMEPK